MFISEICTLCGACIEVCPTGANSITGGKLEIDRKKCNGCGACVKRCRIRARSLQGKTWTVGEVLEVVVKDTGHYRKSGGGVTLTGGEPSSQHKFAYEILKAIKSKGISTAMETCGFVRWEVLAELLQYVDYLLYDIKTLDPAKHKEKTGVDNKIILENAVKASEVMRAKNGFMHVRTPLIPGYNDSRQNVTEIAGFVNEKLHLSVRCGHYTILRYNKYAEGKYDRLGLEVKAHYEPQPEEYIKELNEMLSACD